AGGCETHGRAAADPCDALRDEPRGLFVPCQDVANGARFCQRGIERQDGAARNACDETDSAIFQELDDELGTGGLHVASFWFEALRRHRQAKENPRRLTPEGV